MFGLGAATRIYVAVGPTDMRESFEGLFGLVKERLGCSPLSGHLFLFANARRNRLKVLYWDGTGLWICSKRLERGRLSWPAEGDENGKVQLSYEELALLVGGIELDRTRRKNWYRREESLRAENVEENAGK
ncbi:MAG: transposase [Blastocatellia bacterium]|nr:transposase [Blastocatellia bacterium]